MGLLNWFRQKQVEQIKESSTSEQIETKFVTREDFIQNDYYAEIEVVAPLSGSNRPGFWFYTLYEYSEETGKGKMIEVSDVRNGDKELALFIARRRINLLCQQERIGNG